MANGDKLEVTACMRNRIMNDQEFAEFGEQFKQLSDGTMDLVFFPDTGEFELIPKRKINVRKNMDKKELEKQLKEGASFAYNPVTEEFELAPSRKVNEEDVVTTFTNLTEL